MPDDILVPNVPWTELSREFAAAQLSDPAVLQSMAEAAAAIQAFKETMRGLEAVGLSFDPRAVLKRMQRLRTSTALHRLRGMKVHRPQLELPALSSNQLSPPAPPYRVPAPARLKSISLSRDRVPAAP